MKKIQKFYSSKQKSTRQIIQTKSTSPKNCDFVSFLTGLILFLAVVRTTFTHWTSSRIHADSQRCSVLMHHLFLLQKGEAQSFCHSSTEPTDLSSGATPFIAISPSPTVREVSLAAALQACVCGVGGYHR